MLVLCFTYAFISYPASFLIIAQEKIKIIYLTSALPPIVYWSGILISLPHIGLNAFPMSKFIAISATAIIYYIITIEFLNLTVREFIHKVVVPVSIPLIILIISLSYLAQIMPVEKNGLNLMLIIGMGGLSSSVALFIYYIFSSPFRNYTNDLVRKFFA
jgi:hypothetical protein